MDGTVPKEASYKRKRMQRLAPNVASKNPKIVHIRTRDEVGVANNPNEGVIPLCPVLPRSKNKGKAKEVAVPSPRQTENYEPVSYTPRLLVNHLAC